MSEEHKTQRSADGSGDVPSHIREAASLVKDVFRRMRAAERPAPPPAESDDEWIEED